MNKKVLIVAAVLMGLSYAGPARSQAADDEDDEVAAEKAAAGPTVTTLQIVRKTPKDVEGVTLFHSPGTSFVLTLEAPAGGGDIIGLDEDKTRVTKAVDDKGTDLVGEDGDEKAVSAFFSKVAKSGKRIALPVKLTGRPAKGATKIELEATVSLRVGRDAKEETVKGVKIEKGATFKIAGVDVTLGDPGKPSGFGNFGGGKEKALAVEFTTTQPLDAIKKLTFKSPAGEDLNGKRAGSSSGGMFGSKSYSVTYELDEKVDSIDLVVNAYQKVETIKVPVKMTITLGL